MNNNLQLCVQIFSSFAYKKVYNFTKLELHCKLKFYKLEFQKCYTFLKYFQKQW